MRFLADENFPRSAVTALRRAGFAIDWAMESSPGGPDDAVLARALASGAMILTFFKDFGELPEPSGLSSARFPPYLLAAEHTTY